MKVQFSPVILGIALSQLFLVISSTAFVPAWNGKKKLTHWHTMLKLVESELTIQSDEKTFLLAE